MEPTSANHERMAEAPGELDEGGPAEGSNCCQIGVGRNRAEVELAVHRRPREINEYQRGRVADRGTRQKSTLSCAVRAEPDKERDNV